MGVFSVLSRYGDVVITAVRSVSKICGDGCGWIELFVEMDGDGRDHHSIPVHISSLYDGWTATKCRVQYSEYNLLC